MAAHYKDLREVYAKRMECHGNGMGLMQPIAGEDCLPVCCGYFDRNGDWNFITKLSTEDQGEDGWIPLEREPAKSADLLIEWKPKTSLGVQAIALDGSVESPDNLPAGGSGHIKYTSNNKFGAVLMTHKPITLHAYNDERLFLTWLDANRERLYTYYGTELKKYGLWIVTRTYNAPGASINAWLDNKKDAVVSAKAKASMLGELGQEVDLSDSLTDRDWSHYQAKTPHGLVVFMDGIEIKPFEWWKEAVKFGFRSRSASERRGENESRSQEQSQKRKARSEFLAPPQVQGHLQFQPQTPVRIPKRRSAGTVSRDRPTTLVADDDVLADAGLKQMSRSASLRRFSYAPSVSTESSSTRSPSLRRETRSISGEKG